MNEHTAVQAPRWAVRAAWASAISATVGFIPIHAVWAAGIPLWADPDKFKVWYAQGGGPYLLVLSGLAILAGILPLSLIRPWGQIFPRWVPLLAGRKVPRRTLSSTGFAVSVFLLGYTGWAAWQTAADFTDEGIFSPWIVVFYGIPHFLVWGIGLFMATWSYRARTALRLAPQSPTRTQLLPTVLRRIRPRSSH